MTKVCSRCRREKPLKAFNRCSRHPDGRQRYCRQCEGIYKYNQKRREDESLYYPNEKEKRAAIRARRRKLDPGPLYDVRAL